MRMRGLLGIFLLTTIAACQPAKTPSEECRRQNAWKRVGRSTNPDPRLDTLEDLRCDEMERDERRDAREDRHREEDRQERAQARREVLTAMTPKPPPAPREATRSDPADPATPNLTGLWIGDYGGDRLETVRVHQEGARVLAMKVTGDTNVPAGKPTFRAFLFGTEGDGEGHGADEGYVNPRWIPGHLSVLSADVIEFTWAGVGTVRYKRLRD